MPRRWTLKEEIEKRSELKGLYVNQNKTIFEIAKILGISYQSIFDRLKRPGIPSQPWTKAGYTHKYSITAPDYSEKLAEFAGILLGDGHLSPSTGQVFIYVNSKTDSGYVSYLQDLVRHLFGIEGRIKKRKKAEAFDFIITSIKVREQIGVPAWIARDSIYRKGFLRGFFDTDGSIYKLRFGAQMCFKNRSLPLLESTRQFLLDFNYRPSKISAFSVYITRRNDLSRYVQEIGLGNPKHILRAKTFSVYPRGTEEDKRS